MITISYDFEAKKWVHGHKNQSFQLGSDHIAYAFKTHGLSYKIGQSANRIGPLIGILTSKRNTGPFIGNKKTFIRIQEKIRKLGGLAFVFTAEGCTSLDIIGYMYIPSLKQWVEVRMPYPDVVYNRIPYRKDERKQGNQQIIHQLTKLKIAVFNSHFFSKWDIYQLLQKNENLKSYLPLSFIVSSEDIFKKYLHSLQTVMIKSNTSSQGKNIYKVSTQQGLYICKDNHESKTFKSFNNLCTHIFGNKPHHHYIIQEYVPLNQFEDAPYDFRVIAYYIHSKWKIAGIGVRVAGKTSVTTHVPHGGKILSLNQLQQSVDRREIEKIIIESGQQLRSEYGNVKEFSADIGRTDKNEYYLFELNSKPMIFDEQNIQNQADTFLITSLFEEAKWE